MCRSAEVGERERGGRRGSRAVCASGGGVEGRQAPEWEENSAPLSPADAWTAFLALGCRSIVTPLRACARRRHVTKPAYVMEHAELGAAERRGVPSHRQRGDLRDSRTVCASADPAQSICSRRRRAHDHLPSAPVSSQTASSGRNSRWIVFQGEERNKGCVCSSSQKHAHRDDILERHDDVPLTS